MSNLMVAVPPDFTWTDPSGRQRVFRFVTSRMLSEFCAWINQRHKQNLLRLVPPEEMADATESIDGMLWIVWRSLRENEAEVTLDEVTELFEDWKLLNKVAVTVTTRDSGGNEDKGEGSDPLETH